MKILVTGGAGYIGSHTIVELLNDGHEVVVVDNLSNSSPIAIERVEKITGKVIPLHEFNVEDQPKLDALFEAENFDGAIHFAGLKAVGESVSQPLRYYRTNLESTLVLLEVMQKHNVKKLIFSSSASVYGDPVTLPLKESSPTPSKVASPYGQTKLMIEHILQDIAAADAEWKISILRYFNPVGAHQSGTIGEDPKGIPNNLAPYVSRVAAGKLKELTVHGNDYDTPDGTGVRDYIHVVDLARGHLAALNNLPKDGAATYNLGTGKGSSVLEMIKAFEKAAGHEIAYSIGSRRPGDTASCYCDPSLAKKELGWEATLSLDVMCEDAWRWQQNNPEGYSALNQPA